MKQVLTWLTAIGILVQPALAVTPSLGRVASSTCRADAKNAATTMHDVALDSNKTLHGRVVSSEASPLAHVPVAIHTADGRRVTEVKTNGQGEFSAVHMSSGVYLLTAAGQSEAIRAWSGPMSPPAAINGVELTASEVVRGQGSGGFFPERGGRILNGRLLPPLGVAAAVAIAIAIPVALAHDGDDDAS